MHSINCSRFFFSFAIFNQYSEIRFLANLNIGTLSKHAMA